jgi:hypothetical protein
LKDPTKVQQTIPLAEVPAWVLRQVEQRAFKALSAAQEELSHLITQQRKESNPSPTALAYHIDRCRLRMHDTDVILQDVHLIIAGYIDHAERTSLEELEETTQKLRETKSALEGITSHLPKKESEKDEK